MSAYGPTTETTVGPQANQPTITRHVEPESQALVPGEPEVYFRCACGREAMRRQDLRSEYHREECTARGRC